MAQKVNAIVQQWLDGAIKSEEAMEAIAVIMQTCPCDSCKAVQS